MRISRFVRATLVALALVFTVSTLPSAHAQSRTPLRATSLNPLLPWIASTSIDKFTADALFESVVTDVAKGLGRKPETLPTWRGTFAQRVVAFDAWLTKTVPQASKRSLLLHHALEMVLAHLREDSTGLFPPHKYMLPPEVEGYDKGGVGLLVDRKVDEQGKFVIFETLDGFPGAEIGLKSGDRLVSVDGRALAGLSYREMADLVRGPLGTRVRLVVERPGATTPQTFEVERVWLNPNPKNISYKLLPGDIGYIRVKYLGERLNVELDRVLDTFKKKGVKKIVLDLRNNEGLLVGTQDVGAVFLGNNVEITKLVTRRGAEVRRTQGRKTSEIPLIVLVNRYTSGAGVLLAGALQTRAKALLVGEPTVWRDQPTASRELSDGSIVTVTTGYYVIGNGQKLHATNDSLKIDASVKQNPLEPLGGTDDVQLKKAIELKL